MLIKLDTSLPTYTQPIKLQVEWLSPKFNSRLCFNNFGIYGDLYSKYKQYGGYTNYTIEAYQNEVLIYNEILYQSNPTGYILGFESNKRDRLITVYKDGEAPTGNPDYYLNSLTHLTTQDIFELNKTFERFLLSTLGTTKFNSAADMLFYLIKNNLLICVPNKFLLLSKFTIKFNDKFINFSLTEILGTIEYVFIRHDLRR